MTIQELIEISEKRLADLYKQRDTLVALIKDGYTDEDFPTSPEELLTDCDQIIYEREVTLAYLRELQELKEDDGK